LSGYDVDDRSGGCRLIEVIGGLTGNCYRSWRYAGRAEHRRASTDIQRSRRGGEMKLERTAGGAGGTRRDQGLSSLNDRRG